MLIGTNPAEAPPGRDHVELIVVEDFGITQIRVSGPSRGEAIKVAEGLR